MKTWYDITRELSENTPVFPGDNRPCFRQEERTNYLITSLALSTHSGTHIDAPSHYVKPGRTIDQIALSSVVGKCRVLDLTDMEGEISPEKIIPLIRGTRRILLNTGYTKSPTFDPAYTSLGITTARELAGRGICCIGIDSPSIEAFEGDGAVHRELLTKSIAIIEFLDLFAVPEGDYHLIALPLKLKGLDGSPARVILYRDSG
jgi:arylformamidase